MGIHDGGRVGKNKERRNHQETQTTGRAVQGRSDELPGEREEWSRMGEYRLVEVSRDFPQTERRAAGLPEKCCTLAS